MNARIEKFFKQFPWYKEFQEKKAREENEYAISLEYINLAKKIKERSLEGYELSSQNIEDLDAIIAFEKVFKDRLENNDPTYDNIAKRAKDLRDIALYCHGIKSNLLLDELLKKIDRKDLPKFKILYNSKIKKYITKCTFNFVDIDTDDGRYETVCEDGILSKKEMRKLFLMAFKDIYWKGRTPSICDYMIEEQTVYFLEGEVITISHDITKEILKKEVIK